MFKRDDYVVGIVSILIGLFIIFDASALRAKTSLDPAGPAALPVMIAWGMIVIGVIHLVGAWFANKVLTTKTQTKSFTKKLRDYRAVIAVTVISLAYAGLLDILGYLLMTPLLIGLILWYVHVRDMRHIAKVSVTMTVVLYAIFAFGLKVRLPIGSLFESLF
jgi:membrane-associated HD superfamily phosphohydrolase